MLLKWIGFLFGYVTVLVRGGSCERFMNLCAVKRRDVWDFKIVPDGLMMKVRASEYRNLRAAARRAGCRFHIVSKHGLPFLLRRYRHRYGLVLGVLVFVFLLQILCARVWEIRVQGTNAMEPAQVLSILEEFGIREGIPANALDWASVRQGVIAKHPEISWMSFNPVGTVLYVDISETTPVPEIVDHEQPCNLKAGCDGRIISMQINLGNPVVQVGDAVVKGDLLVSGAVEYGNGCTVLRHASGVVMAETNHTVSFETPLAQTHYQRTGKQTIRRVFNCFGVSIPLYVGSVCEPYEKETNRSDLRIGGNKLPFGLQTAVFYETEPVSVVLSEKEAETEGVEKVDAYIQTELKDTEIIRVDYEHTLTDGVLTTKAKIFCKENIGFEEKMLIF